MAGGCLSGRLRPASWLVPFLAAGELRNARAGALRHGHYPWFHHGRGWPQDVEVARQYGGAAGCYGKVRRGYPAPVGDDDRLLGRSAPRPERAADQYRRVSETPQHDPLDARYARP